MTALQTCLPKIECQIRLKLSSIESHDLTQKVSLFSCPTQIGGVA